MGLRWGCDICDYSSKTTTALKMHKQHKHEGIKYPCDECSHVASKLDNLRRQGIQA